MPSMPPRTPPAAPRECRAGDWRVALLPAAGYCADYVAPTAALGFAFDSQRGEHAIASDRVEPFFAMPNRLAFVPAGCPVYSRSALGGEYLQVIPPQDGQPWPQQPFSDVVCATALPLAQGLRRALLVGAEALEVQAQALALAECVRQLQGQPVPRAAGWMTPARMRRIDELIEAQLEPGLSVGQLAQALGLSEGFFARAFRAAVGIGPHRYLIERRLARARQLLAAGAADLAQVALSCGFASHAHLSASCRRYLGLTPQQLRRG